MSLSADRNEQFSEQSYWEQRYSDDTEQDFDWFRSYADLAELFREVIPSTSSRILMLGCGNSTLSPSMHADGYKDIINIDYSSVCIDKMRTRYPDQQWHVMDITQLDTPSNLVTLGGAHSFDIAIDKGTMDALMAEGRSASVWHPSEKVVHDVAKELQGVSHLLKPAQATVSGGKLIYITFGQPHFRLPHLESIKDWTIEVRTLGDMFHYFVYICTKR